MNGRLNIKRRQANFLAIPNGMQEAHLPPLSQLRLIFKQDKFYFLCSSECVLSSCEGRLQTGRSG